MYFIRFLLVWMVAYETNGKRRNRQVAGSDRRLLAESCLDAVEGLLCPTVSALGHFGLAPGGPELIVRLLQRSRCDVAPLLRLVELALG
jgi:hypothetical protein